MYQVLISPVPKPNSYTGPLYELKLNFLENF
jgi:hypothetical protein